MKQEYVATVRANGRFFVPIPDSVAKMLNLRDADLFKPILTPDGLITYERVDVEDKQT